MHSVGQTLIIYILANQKQLSESQICPPSQGNQDSYTAHRNPKLYKTTTADTMNFKQDNQEDSSEGFNHTQDSQPEGRLQKLERLPLQLLGTFLVYPCTLRLQATWSAIPVRYLETTWGKNLYYRQG